MRKMIMEMLEFIEKHTGRRIAVPKWRIQYICELDTEIVVVMDDGAKHYATSPPYNGIVSSMEAEK